MLNCPALFQLATKEHVMRLKLLLLIAWLCLGANVSAAKTDFKEVASRIESLYGETITSWFEEAQISYPPAYVKLEVYKQERVVAVFAGESPEKSREVKRLAICAMDFEPGPKLQEGDEKTPEGIYSLRPLTNSKNWFMWMDIQNPFHRGKVNTGDSFYLCTDYPKAEDRKRSDSIGIKNPGSAICIHGNCVSRGCPSLRNTDFAMLFAIVMHHDKQQFGAPQVAIYPFEELDLNLIESFAIRAAAESPNATKLGAKKIAQYWRSFMKGREVHPAALEPSQKDASIPQNFDESLEPCKETETPEISDF